MESSIPFVYRRLIRWGDADPALIVYTARFLDFVLEASEAWFVETIGFDWYHLTTRRGLGMPVVHSELDFAMPLVPGDVAAIAVSVERIGASSLTLGFRATRPDGRCSFSAGLVHALVEGRP